MHCKTSLLIFGVTIFYSNQVLSQILSNNDEEEMCFPLRRASSVRTFSGQHGRPGKIRPPGDIGPKGDRGEAGKCGCDPSEVEQLNTTIHQLQGYLLTNCLLTD